MRRNEVWLAAAWSAVLLLAGCAAPRGFFGGGPPQPPFADPQLTVPAAAQRVAPGQAKPEVQARLGPGEVLRFDSGYEVWVYRSKGAPDPRAAPELVLLFEPAGTLAKVREKPAYGAPAR
ncbi:hypothetical protein PE066_02780 [Ramlibacter tataouinensis]|uniref:hypothetical protein n=1 Tax=Ramlibacter tataouinensis TaxID=94132 RepID=UPI0022F38846|nr:hypothetical protein [Ramlibacter tataouinensis]WBY02480.1 hypothetical protein PE066_02780 [Ramlibacter tataouinensis]